MAVMNMICLVVMLGALSSVLADSNWHLGRGTYYGTDGWSIHTGSCGYGQLAEDVGTGWDIAALTDVAWDHRGSCGRCKEVRCKPMGFKDGYGAWLDRSNVCFDPSASVVVMITDTCPCVYPNNWVSNRRWCCGDMYHLDLSIWAFEKLSDTKWGVIALEWRDVSCSHRVHKQAKNPWGGRARMPSWYMPRPGWRRWMDKRLPLVKKGGRKMA